MSENARAIIAQRAKRRCLSQIDSTHSKLLASQHLALMEETIVRHSLRSSLVCNVFFQSSETPGPRGQIEKLRVIAQEEQQLYTNFLLQEVTYRRPVYEYLAESDDQLVFTTAL